ncbi:MAG: hypothetical protein WCP73_05270 [Eubacteriales bacterium]
MNLFEIYEALPDALGASGNEPVADAETVGLTVTDGLGLAAF